MSDETTDGKSVPEALRMIAAWIDGGRDIEVKPKAFGTWSKNNEFNKGDTCWLDSYIYRAKPRKPRMAVYDFTPEDVQLVDMVELTPEVRAALEEKGLMP